MCSALDIDHPEDPLKLARIAVDENPRNAPFLSPNSDIHPVRIALLTTKWWRAEKTKFTFGFLDSVKPVVADRIKGFANVWAKVSALSFDWTNDVASADFRLAFENSGFWSYLGTDCRSIPRNRPTMNLQGMNSLYVDDAEMLRVVPHEFAHAFGCPHEHSRAEIIAKLDAAKTIKVFRQEQGWSESTVRAQILTPISESALHGATEPDALSIMTYFFSGSCTKDGKPILGGKDLSPLDKQFAAKMWPPVVAPPPPPPVTPANVVTAKDGTKYVVTLERAQ
jgi:hypothetical protein